MIIAEAIALATDALKQHDVPDPQRDAVILVSHVLERDRAFLIAHPNFQITPAKTDHLKRLVSRRLAREPLQYIVGRQEFYGLDFEVSPSVLIPRPETELLVEHAIAILGSRRQARLCEIGVGSGCITVSILYRSPDARAIAVDISEDALQVARRNAVKHGVSDRVAFIPSNVFDRVPFQRFDAILSNPPYVPSSDLRALQPEVRDFEPAVALIGGSDGLHLITQIVQEAPKWLIDGGSLVLEIGFDQSEKVRHLLTERFWRDVDLLPDLQGIPRILTAIKRSSS